MKAGIYFTAIVVASGCLVAQTRDVVGTWKLVSATATTAAGGIDNAPFGPNPKGLLIYTHEGRMSAMISYSGRKPLSGGDRIASPADERAAAFATFFAYGGRFSIEGGKITHHVELASVENWVNTDLIRVIKFDGERMTLITPPMTVGGTIRSSELIWERVK